MKYILFVRVVKICVEGNTVDGFITLCQPKI